MSLRRLLIAVAVASSVAMPVRAEALTEKGFKSLHILTKILHYVEENYVVPADEQNLIRGAIRGMLGTLDPHTVYLSPEVYRELKVDTSGRFDGIGIEVTLRDGWLTVLSPIKDSPADKAGVQAGDRIIRINGHSTKDLNLSEAISMMRGRRGSRMTLTVARSDIKNPLDITIVRTIIKVPSIRAELYDGKYAYIGISSFQSGTSHAMEKALKDLSEKGKIEGLVLDLRHNPGGLLDQGVAVSDLFLDHGVIVTTESRGQEIDRREAHGEGTQPDYPIVVLVDSGSASAAEIVAGALQDNKRATVMGVKSFGKGSVQTVIDLDDGSGLKLTIAHYKTPSGRIIQDQGIIPDIMVPAKRPQPVTAAAPKEGEAAEEEQAASEDVAKKEGGVKKEEAKPEAKKEDYQLERALEYLRTGGASETGKGAQGKGEPKPGRRRMK